MDLETRPQGDIHGSFQPPEYFPFDHAVVRWHPKITGYRLLVLLTTICLGIGKAVATARGAVFVSVRTEWVSGVGVSVLLYGLGLYDDDHLQQRMKWLFDKDLTANCWSVSYRNDEVGLTPGFHLSRHPPITGYRIAITASVLLFGTAKATLGYLGHSLAANYVDWAFGVIVTSALYCFGLYENNSVGLFPTFFATDYGPYLREVLFAGLREIPIYSLCLLVCSKIIYASVWMLINQFESFSALRAELSFLDSAYYLAVKSMIAQLLLVALLLGVFGMGATLWVMTARVLNIRESEGLPAPVQHYVFSGALFILYLYWPIWLSAYCLTHDGWWTVLTNLAREFDDGLEGS